MRPDEPVRSDEMDDLHGLLAAIDHPPPPLSADAVVALAEARTRMHARRTALRWAAAVMLSVGVAGAAVAASGSPVLRWVTELVQRVSGRREGPAPAPAPQGAQSEKMAGIAVLPGDSFTVTFTAPGAGGVVLVSFHERAEILARARPGAARFTTEPDRLLIEPRAAGDTFALEIPRRAARVELRAGGARLLVVERGRVSPASAADSLGRYVVRLPGGGR